MTDVPRLLLVEDDSRLGPLIAEVLSAQWDIDLVTDAEAALTSVSGRSYSVMIVDRRLPGMDGAELIRRLRAARIGIPILMLTALGTLRDKVTGLDAGANDYLVKPFDFEELNARLHALTRDYSGGGERFEIGSWSFYPTDNSIDSPYTGRVILTPRESAMLRLLASDPVRTFSRQHLLSAVFEHGEQLGTVDTYVHYIRRKTEPDLISTVRGRGYRLGTPA